MHNTLEKMIGKEVNIETLERYGNHLGWLYMGYNKRRTSLIFVDDLINGREIDVIVEFVSNERVKIKKVIKRYF